MIRRWSIGLCAFAVLVAAVNGEEVKVVSQWQGSYPTARLELLPKGQQETAYGYLGDARTFEAVWKALKPDEKPPEVDFKENLVLFARNVRFVNSIKITKVDVTDGTAKLSAIETRTARPIQDKVFMSLAVVPRKGIKKLAVGVKSIDVEAAK